eukprot:2224536-Pleurochrysis_carterae.AAC.1
MMSRGSTKLTLVCLHACALFLCWCRGKQHALWEALTTSKRPTAVQLETAEFTSTRLHSFEAYITPSCAKQTHSAHALTQGDVQSMQSAMFS